MTNNFFWKFTKSTRVEELIFNPLVKHFYKLGVDTLVRENIQNSLDGKMPKSNEPVEVIIELGEVRTSELPGIDEIRDHIESLSGYNEETIATIKHMKNKMKLELVPYISFEDRNTKGLKGAQRGDKYNDGDTYGIYAYKKGVHDVAKSAAVESIRGGSHGVGKIASNAASNIHLMYFANCDELGDQHFGGTIQLIEHEYKNEKFRATGYFTDEINGIFYPYKNNFGEIFKKDTRGLKIIIPFLQEAYTDPNSIIRAVCDNFFMAILNNKLVVYVNSQRIAEDTILDILKNVSIYENQKISEMVKNFTNLYMKTYLEESMTVLKVSDLSTEYSFLFHLQYNPEIKKGRVGIIRRIGMKIEDFKVSGHAKTSFNAVLIPMSDKEDIFLKSLENESHTKISGDYFKDIGSQRNAIRFINNLSKQIAERISEKIKEANPTDGMINTEDLLYSVEHNFKKILEDQAATVEVSKGTGTQKIQLVKKAVNSIGNCNKKVEKEKIEKEPKKRDRKDQINRPRESFAMAPESVNRVVLKNSEHMLIDLSEQKNYTGEKFCNILLKVIDGTGNESSETLDLVKNYDHVRDKNTDKKVNMRGNCLKNVSISSGNISLEMKLKAEANTSLKFIYFVEV